MKLLTKAVALSVSISFLGPSLSFAFEASTYPAAVQSKTSSMPLINGKPFTLSAELGRCIASHQGDPGRTIVFIHDLHCNYEVQGNIARILEILASQNDLRLIGAEGDSTPVDVTKLSTFPDAKVREQAGRYFLKRGRITGAEYFAATQGYPVWLEGIENTDLYARNKKVLMSFMNAESQGYCEDLRSGFEHLKSLVYSEDLSKLDHLRQEYEEERMTLESYCSQLLAEAGRRGVSMDFFPLLTAFAATRHIPTDSRSDHDQWLAEAGHLDEVLRKKLYTSTDQERLDQVMRLSRIIENMINISATAPELAYYRTHRSEFSVEEMLVFLDDLGLRYGLGLRVDPAAAALQGYLEKAAVFYDLADRRSESFVENTLARMQEHGQRTAALIVGGFHAEQVEEMLAKNKLSFISIKPRLTRTDLENPYYSILQNQRAPLEKLLARNENIFAPSSLLIDPMFKKYVDGVVKFLDFADKRSDQTVAQDLARYPQNDEGVRVSVLDSTADTLALAIDETVEGKSRQRYVALLVPSRVISKDPYEILNQEELSEGLTLQMIRPETYTDNRNKILGRSMLAGGIRGLGSSLLAGARRQLVLMAPSRLAWAGAAIGVALAVSFWVVPAATVALAVAQLAGVAALLFALTALAMHPRAPGWVRIVSGMLAALTASVLIFQSAPYIQGVAEAARVGAVEEPLAKLGEGATGLAAAPIFGMSTWFGKRGQGREETARKTRWNQWREALEGLGAADLPAYHRLLKLLGTAAEIRTLKGKDLLSIEGPLDSVEEINVLIRLEENIDRVQLDESALNRLIAGRRPNTNEYAAAVRGLLEMQENIRSAKIISGNRLGERSKENLAVGEAEAGSAGVEQITASTELRTLAQKIVKHLKTNTALDRNNIEEVNRLFRAFLSKPEHQTITQISRILIDTDPRGLAEMIRLMFNFAILHTFKETEAKLVPKQFRDQYTLFIAGTMVRPGEISLGSDLDYFLAVKDGATAQRQVNALNTGLKERLAELGYAKGDDFKIYSYSQLSGIAKELDVYQKNKYIGSAVLYGDKEGAQSLASLQEQILSDGSYLAELDKLIKDYMTASINAKSALRIYLNWSLAGAVKYHMNNPTYDMLVKRLVSDGMITQEQAAELGNAFAYFVGRRIYDDLNEKREEVGKFAENLNTTRRIIGGLTERMFRTPSEEIAFALYQYILSADQEAMPRELEELAGRDQDVRWLWDAVKSSRQKAGEKAGDRNFMRAEIARWGEYIQNLAPETLTALSNMSLTTGINTTDVLESYRKKIESALKNIPKEMDVKYGQQNPFRSLDQLILFLQAKRHPTVLREILTLLNDDPEQFLEYAEAVDRYLPSARQIYTLKNEIQAKKLVNKATELLPIYQYLVTGPKANAEGIRDTNQASESARDLLVKYYSQIMTTNEPPIEEWTETKPESFRRLIKFYHDKEHATIVSELQKLLEKDKEGFLRYAAAMDAYLPLANMIYTNRKEILSYGIGERINDFAKYNFNLTVPKDAASAEKAITEARDILAKYESEKSGTPSDSQPGSRGAANLAVLTSLGLAGLGGLLVVPAVLSGTLPIAAAAVLAAVLGSMAWGTWRLVGSWGRMSGRRVEVTWNQLRERLAAWGAQMARNPSLRVAGLAVLIGLALGPYGWNVVLPMEDEGLRLAIGLGVGKFMEKIYANGTGRKSKTPSFSMFNYKRILKDFNVGPRFEQENLSLVLGEIDSYASIQPWYDPMGQNFENAISRAYRFLEDYSAILKETSRANNVTYPSSLNTRIYRVDDHQGAFAMVIKNVDQEVVADFLRDLQLFIHLSWYSASQKEQISRESRHLNTPSPKLIAAVVNSGRMIMEKVKESRSVKGKARKASSDAATEKGLTFLSGMAAAAVRLLQEQARPMTGVAVAEENRTISNEKILSLPEIWAAPENKVSTIELYIKNQGILANWLENTLDRIAASKENPFVKVNRFKELYDLMEDDIPNDDMYYLLIILNHISTLRQEFRSVRNVPPHMEKRLEKILTDLTGIWKERYQQYIDSRVRKAPEVEAAEAQIDKLINYPKQETSAKELAEIVRSVTAQLGISSAVGTRVKTPFSIYKNFHRKWVDLGLLSPAEIGLDIITSENIRTITDDVVGGRVFISNITQAERIINSLVPKLRREYPEHRIEVTGSNLRTSNGPDGSFRISIKDRNLLYWDAKIKIRPSRSAEQMDFGAEIKFTGLTEDLASLALYSILKQQLLPRIITIQSEDTALMYQTAWKLGKRVPDYRVLPVGWIYRIAAYALQENLLQGMDPGSINLDKWFNIAAEKVWYKKENQSVDISDDIQRPDIKRIIDDPQTQARVKDMVEKYIGKKVANPHERIILVGTDPRGFIPRRENGKHYFLETVGRAQDDSRPLDLVAIQGDNASRIIELIQQDLAEQTFDPDTFKVERGQGGSVNFYTKAWTFIAAILLALPYGDPATVNMLGRGLIGLAGLGAVSYLATRYFSRKIQTARDSAAPAARSGVGRETIPSTPASPVAGSLVEEIARTNWLSPSVSDLGWFASLSMNIREYLKEMRLSEIIGRVTPRSLHLLFPTRVYLIMGSVLFAGLVNSLWAGMGSWSIVWLAGSLLIGGILTESWLYSGFRDILATAEKDTARANQMVQNILKAEPGLTRKAPRDQRLRDMLRKIRNVPGMINIKYPKAILRRLRINFENAA